MNRDLQDRIRACSKDERSFAELIRLFEDRTQDPESGHDDESGIKPRTTDNTSGLPSAASTKPVLHKFHDGSPSTAPYLRNVFSLTQTGIWLVDVNFRTLDINPAMCEFLGCTPEKALGRSVFELIDTDSANLFRAQITGMQPDALDHEFELTLKSVGRSPALCRLKLAAIHAAPDNTVIAIFGNSLNEALQWKIELEKSQQNFRALFNNTHDAIFILHPHSEEILDVNDRACELFGSSRYTLQGIPLQLNAQDSSWDSLTIRDTQDEKASIEFETIQYTKSGKTLFLVVSATIISFNNRPAILCVARDITDNKRLKELRASEQRFQTLLERTGVGVAVLSSSGGFLQTSTALQQMLGYSYAELRQKTLPEIARPEDRDNEERLLREIMNGNNIGYRSKKRLIRKDGSTVHAILTLTVLHNHLNKPQVAIGILENISEMKEQEAELRRKKELAEELSSLHNSLLTSLNFEVRTPINGILGFATLLQKELTDPEQKDFAQMIYSSAESVMNTIKNLITIAKLEAEGDADDSVRIAPAEEIRTVCECYVATARNNGLTLHLDIHDTETHILMAAERLRQVLGNVLNYTINYTSSGSIRVTVSAESEAGKALCIEVHSSQHYGKDSALSSVLSGDLHNKLEAQQNHGGTGLGLLVAQRLLEHSGGSIDARPVPEGGTIISVHIPAADSAAETTGEEKPPQWDTLPSDAERLPKILVVEDDQFGQQLVAHFIKGVCAADIASSGTTALGLCRENVYDLVLMDINLGQNSMDGVRTLRKMRQIHGYDRTPAIALTAYALSNEKEKYLREGFTDFLPKPFNKKRLLETLSTNLLRTSRTPGEAPKPAARDDGAAS